MRSLTVIILVIFCVFVNSVTSQNCTELRGDCTKCLQTSGCAYCASPPASGCFVASLGAYCPLLGGVANDCSAQGTHCVQYSDCTSCQLDPGCTWCDTPTGYCFNSTGGNVLCTQLAGTWDPPTCPSTSTTTGAVTTTGGSTTGSVNQYRTVDPNAKCEDFAGSQCVGTVFYNVYINQSYSQDQMSTQAASLFAFAGLPGVSSECRSIGTLLNCGSSFPQCQSLPDTSVVVSIPICRSLCESFVAACGDALSVAGITYDCNAVDSVTGVYTYPVDSVEYEYQGNIYEFSCNTMIAGDAGYYPNKLINADFTQFESDNETLSTWEALGNVSTYRIMTDIENGTTNNVLELEFNSVYNSNPIGISQNVVLNRNAIFPVRIKGTSKAVNVLGTQDEGYAVYADLYYSDGSSERVTASFPTGDHDYEEEIAYFTPSKPIQNFTFVVNLGKDGIAYFDNIAFQEKVPDAEQASYVCFLPFDFDSKWQEHNADPCQIACPVDGIWDRPNAYNAVRPVYSTLSWLSFVGNIFLIATWLTFKEKRKYPERIVLYFSICVLIVSFHGVLGSFFTKEEVTCKDRFTFLTTTNSFLCGFMGVILQFGAAGALGWWLCLSISTWVMIRFHMKQSNFSHFERYYHIGCWSYAAISTIIPLAATEFQSGIGVTGCWISTAHHSAYQLVSFYIPEGICLVVACFLIGDSVRIIKKITGQSTALKSTARKKRTLETYIRFGGFVVIILINVLFLFTYKFYTYGNEDQWEADFGREVLCRANGGTEEECKIVRLNSVLYLLNSIGIGIEGIIIFVFFGVSKKNYTLWRDLLLLKTRGTAFGSLLSTLVSNESGKTGNSSTSEVDSRKISKRVDSTNSIDLQVKSSASTTATEN